MRSKRGGRIGNGRSSVMMGLGAAGAIAAAWGVAACGSGGKQEPEVAASQPIVADDAGGDGATETGTDSGSTTSDPCNPPPIGDQCPSGQHQYCMPEGGLEDDSGTRYVCGDFAYDLCNCMTNGLSQPYWQVTEFCQYPPEGHAIGMTQICGQLCLIEPQWESPGTSGTICCWTPPSGTDTGPGSTPAVSPECAAAAGAEMRCTSQPDGGTSAPPQTINVAPQGSPCQPYYCAPGQPYTCYG